MAISKIKLPDNSVQDIHDSRVPLAAWFNQANTTMYWFASIADKASFIADQTQTSLVLFSTFVDLVLKRIILTDSAGETTKSTTEDQTTLSITVNFAEQEKPIAGGTWQDVSDGAIDLTVYVDTGNTGTYTQLGTTQHFVGPDDYTVNVRNSLVLGTNKVKIECVANTDSTITSYIEYTVTLQAEAYIVFADPNVGAVCATNWGDGVGITKTQAAAVAYSSNQQKNQFWNALSSVLPTMTSFNELEFFTNVNTIEPLKFKDNTSLTSISLKNITIIYDAAFSGCSSLSMELDAPNLTGEQSAYETFKGTAITKIKSLGNITKMGAYGCFQNCTSLTEVTLPSTLSIMNRLMFQGCSNLESVIILATTPPSITGANFKDTGNCKIYVPYSVDHSILTAYQTTWGANSGANTHDVPRLAELNPDGTIPT